MEIMNVEERFIVYPFYFNVVYSTIIGRKRAESISQDICYPDADLIMFTGVAARLFCPTEKVPPYWLDGNMQGEGVRIIFEYPGVHLRHNVPLINILNRPYPFSLSIPIVVANGKPLKCTVLNIPLEAEGELLGVAAHFLVNKGKEINNGHR